MSQETRIELKNFQAEFLKSKVRFPALIAGIGTGKTLMLLLKLWQYCIDYPNSLALVVRKEYTDLKDSTIADFKRYFSVDIDSEKNFKFPNGSMLMFRHGNEINVLKNLNLSIVGIEQAEEFETEETFDFLRDRLRRQNAPYRQLCVIANARGHNWLWKRWVQQGSAIEINQPTGEYSYVSDDYFCCTANTFANEDNLPADFIKDLRRMETESPNHYKQYILNSFEELEEDDLLFTFQELESSRKLEFTLREGYGMRLAGFDIARYGNDKCAVSGIQQIGALYWRMFHCEQWEKRDLDYTTGRILSTAHSLGTSMNIIDEDGLGAGPIDTITKGHSRNDFVGFTNPNVSRNNDSEYGNARTKYAFKLKEMVQKGWIQIKFEEAIQELMTLRYRYLNDGRKILVSKEEMRKKGFKSPNVADSLIYAISLIGTVKETQDRQYVTLPKYSKEGNLFELGGIR